MQRLVIFVLAILSTRMSAQAAVIRVPGEQPSIAAGLAAASSGDVVEVACGTYHEHNLFTDRELLLRSATGRASCVTIEADGAGRCLSTGGNIVVEGFTFTGGQVPGDGGGYSCNAGSPILRHCTITGSSANRGGGIYVRTGAPTFEDCLVSSNTTTSVLGQGGGAHCAPGTTTRFDRCVFSDNSAYAVGGAIYAARATVTVTDCDLVDNEAPAAGGLFAGSTSTVTVLSSRINANSATTGGGAYLVHDDAAPAPVSFSACRFAGNDAEFGGAVYIEGSVLDRYAMIDFDDCLFLANIALDGGGMFLNSVRQITNCRFVSNVANGTGGGAIRIVNASPSVTGCTFEHNRATDGNGGALWVWGATSAITGCTFSENDAGLEGGHVWLSYGGLVLDRTILAFSEHGEPVHCAVGDIASITCSDVYGNASGDWVGCLAPRGGVDGNLELDPAFCARASGNLYIDSLSPCAPSNNSCDALIGALPVACGPVSIAQRSWGRVKSGYR